MSDDFQNDDNPYAVSFDQSSAHEPVAGDDRQFFVDGKLIRCGQSVHLPRLCIRTGETEDLVPVTKTLSHSPRILFVLVMCGLLGIILLAILHYALRKTCTVTYYITASTKSRLLYQKIGGALLFIAAIVGFGFAISSDMPTPMTIGAIVTMFVGIILLTTANALAVEKHEEGQRFWLKGAKQPFFDRMKQIFDSTGALPY